MTSEVFVAVESTKPRWIWFVVAFISALMAWGLVQQIGFGIPWGNNPASDELLWLLAAGVGVGAPVLAMITRIRYTIDAETLTWSFRPFWRKSIGLDRIRAVEVCTFRPIRDYGGWGIRYAPGRGWCVTLSGNRGVLLTFDDGKTLLLGSSDPETLLEEVRRRTSTAES